MPILYLETRIILYHVEFTAGLDYWIQSIERFEKCGLAGLVFTDKTCHVTYFKLNGIPDGLKWRT